MLEDAINNVFDIRISSETYNVERILETIADYLSVSVELLPNWEKLYLYFKQNFDQFALDTFPDSVMDKLAVAVGVSYKLSNWEKLLEETIETNELADSENDFNLFIKKVFSSAVSFIIKKGAVDELDFIIERLITYSINRLEESSYILKASIVRTFSRSFLIKAIADILNQIQNLPNLKNYYFLLIELTEKFKNKRLKYESLTFLLESLNSSEKLNQKDMLLDKLYSSLNFNEDASNYNFIEFLNKFLSATKVINENKWNQIFEYTRNSKNKMFGLLIPSLIELKYFDYAKSIFKEFISVKSINEKEKPEFKLLNFLILASQFSQRGLMNKWNATIKNGILTLKESKVIPDIFNLLIQHIRAKGIAEFKSDNYLEMVVDSIELNNFILKDYKFNVHVNFALRILDFDENLLNKTMLEKLIQFIEHYNVDNTDLSSRWSAIESKENIQFELRRKLIKISEVSVQENIISQIFEIFDEIDFGYTKYKNFKSIILEIISERITVLNKDVLMAHIAQLIEHSNPKSTKESVFYEVVIKIFQNKNLDFEYINDLISIFENNEDLSQLVIAIEILKSENLHSADFLKYKEVINKVGEINERATFELILKIILEIKNNSIKIGLLESLTSFPLLSNNLDLIIRIATELVKMNATSRAKELVETSINSYKAKFNISNANQGNEFRELLDGIEYKYRISILLELSNFQRLIESNLEVIEFISSEIFALMQEYMANQSFSWSNIFEILFNIPNCENIFKRIFYSNDLWTYADNYYSNSIELFNRSSIIKHLMDNASETNIGFLKKIFSTIANSKNLSDKEELFTEIFTLTKK